jgi:hypothetical protein
MYDPFKNPDDFDIFVEATLAACILFVVFMIGGLL